MVWGTADHPTPKDIPELSHDKVFREKFCFIHMVKVAWNLLTDLFLNRLSLDYQANCCFGLVTATAKATVRTVNQTRSHKPFDIRGEV